MSRIAGKRESSVGTVVAVIDLKRLAEDPDYREGAVRKGAEPDRLDSLLADDAERRRQLGLVEDLRAKANAANKEIGSSSPDERPARIEAATVLKNELSALEADLDEVAARVDSATLEIPNPAHESVPSGGEDDFELIREVGEQVAPPPLDHADYGEKMGFIDTERGVRTSGSRFAYLMREAVLVEFALVQWIMQKLVANQFVPVVPPVLVREDMMIDSGFFPTDRNQVYEVTEDGLFLTGTSEIALAGLHRNERIDLADLPLRYAGFSSCFRREAGTYGKDTRGIFRVHQFDKVEMFSYTSPDESWNELERIREIEESIVSELGLPYRVINTAAGDLGNPAAKKYDIEVWLPSEGRYREVTSCSNYTDYSARRLGARYKGEDSAGLVHTLNGTACAVGRTLLNLFEYGQQPDGSWVIPEVLRPLCGLEVVEPR